MAPGRPVHIPSHERRSEAPGRNRGPSKRVRTAPHSRLPAGIPSTETTPRQPSDSAISRRRRRHAPRHWSALCTLAHRGMSTRLRVGQAGEDPGPPLCRTYAARDHLGVGATDPGPTTAFGAQIAAVIQSHPARTGGRLPLGRRRNRSHLGVDPSTLAEAEAAPGISIPHVTQNVPGRSVRRSIRRRERRARYGSGGPGEHAALLSWSRSLRRRLERNRMEQRDLPAAGHAPPDHRRGHDDLRWPPVEDLGLAQHVGLDLDITPCAQIEPHWVSWRLWAALGFVESGFWTSGHCRCLVPSLELDWGKHAQR
jgi:hypothetical protein